jgi:hypothetical protein
MTTPYERTRSVQITDKFLIDLLRQPRVPKWIRERARQCLRHFPTEYDMQRLETMDNAQMKKDAI